MVGYNLVHVGHRAVHIYVHVGHHAVGFLAGFGNLTVQGRCCRNLVLTVSCFFFCREEPVGAEPEYLGDPDRLHRRYGSAYTVLPRHCTDPPWPR